MNAGVVGCGYWGPNLVRNLFESGRCEQVYCYDPDRSRLKWVSGRFPSVRIASSLEELIAACDAVLVSTPVSTHASIAHAVIASGKGVFVEKPLAGSVKEAAQLVMAAEAQDVTLMVGHTFVYSSPVQKVKEYIDGGLLGDLYFVSSSRVNLGLHRQDVNVIWDLAPHDVSMLIHWLGEAPSEVSANGRACVGLHADVATMHCKFASGVVANLEVSWLAPSKLRRTVVVGSRKMVVYDDTQPSEKIKLFDSGAEVSAPATYGEYQLTYRSGDMVSPRISATEPLLVQINHFLDCVQNGTTPSTDGRVGLQVVATIEAACESLRSNGRLVSIAEVMSDCGIPLDPVRLQAMAAAAGRGLLA